MTEKFGAGVVPRDQVGRSTVTVPLMETTPVSVATNAWPQGITCVRSPGVLGVVRSVIHTTETLSST